MPMKRQTYPDCTPKEIEAAAALVDRIDCCEGRLYRENARSAAVLRVYLVNGRVVGTFCGYEFGGRPRAAIAFVDDAYADVDELAALFREFRAATGDREAALWMRHDNPYVAVGMTTRLRFDRPPYASTEYAVRRGRERPFALPDGLSLRPYDDGRIDDYLALLDASMTFAHPTPAYAANRGGWQNNLRGCAKARSFEALWRGDALLGLYWRNDGEIDTMAVAPEHRRLGCGSLLLTRAIERAFAATDEPAAYLYCVDWNDKGRIFYRKYGMEARAHSYMLVIP